MIAGEGGVAKAVFCLRGVLLPSLPGSLVIKQCWGELVVCQENPIKAGPTGD